MKPFDKYIFFLIAGFILRRRSRKWKNTKICMAEYKNDAGMIGAFYHFRAMQKKRK